MSLSLLGGSKLGKTHLKYAKCGLTSSIRGKNGLDWLLGFLQLAGPEDRGPRRRWVFATNPRRADEQSMEMQPSGAHSADRCGITSTIREGGNKFT